MSNLLAYSCSPIYSIHALSLVLGLEKELLLELARTANERYRLARPIPKSDGTFRQPFDALEPLKEVHNKLKQRIFSRVAFPAYLTGSLKGRDYLANAALHAGSRIAICEDIKKFFPSTSSELVFDIWRHFFGFSDEVAVLLSALTTKDGFLPEGAITSSFLANLAFWRDEPKLQAKLSRQGIIYSRYVDDITVSSHRFLPNTKKSEVIAEIYGMLRKRGYYAKRSKHEVFTSGDRMFTTKVMVNKRPALVSKERSMIRAAVFQLEARVADGEIGAEILAELNKVAGRVGKLSRFHSGKGKVLMDRVRQLRTVLAKET